MPHKEIILVAAVLFPGFVTLAISIVLVVRSWRDLKKWTKQLEDFRKKEAEKWPE